MGKGVGVEVSLEMEEGGPVEGEGWRGKCDAGS